MDKVWLKLMQLFAPTCHQKACRSYFIKGYQMPVCSRCFGIFLGNITWLICFWFISINIFWYFIFLIPMTLDGLIQLNTNYESTNTKRLITGFLGGIAYIGLFFSFIDYIF